MSPNLIVPRPRARAFAQVNVFSAAPYRGNPVAVVLDADDLSGEAMAAFARWTNLSETTFVLSPRVEGADFRLRIFTPEVELPFAGHPTLGSGEAWLDHATSSSRTTVVQECAAGLVPLRRTGPGLALRAPDITLAGSIAQALLNLVVRALGIDRSSVRSNQWASGGAGWAIVELESAAAVLGLHPDFAGVPELDIGPDLKVGVVGAHPAGSDSAFEIRAFVPGWNGSVAEDPVTGSLGAAVAQWLLRERRAPAHFSISQGSSQSRSGRITVDSDPDGALWIGGECTINIRGIVDI